MKLDECLAVGEKALKAKLPPYRAREIRGVSGEDTVLVIPPVRIRDVVRIHVPAAIAGVPVDVHRPEFSYRMPSEALLFEYSQSCIVHGASKLTSIQYQFLYF